MPHPTVTPKPARKPPRSVPLTSPAARSLPDRHIAWTLRQTRYPINDAGDMPVLLSPCHPVCGCRTP